MVKKNEKTIDKLDFKEFDVRKWTKNEYNI
jgi:hypothetical protein